MKYLEKELSWNPHLLRRWRENINPPPPNPYQKSNVKVAGCNMKKSWNNIKYSKVSLHYCTQEKCCKFSFIVHAATLTIFFKG